MSLLLRTHYKLARSSLKRARTRALLTCLGISIGVASIVLILSLTGSVRQLITNQIHSTGKDVIIVHPKFNQSSLSGLFYNLTSTNFNSSSLTLAHVKSIKHLDSVTAVAPLSITSRTVKAKHTIDSVNILGTTPDFVKITHLPLKSGSFLSDHSSSSLKSAVIGKSLSLKLFNTTEPIGKTFTILGQRFIITGVFATTDDPINLNRLDFDDSIVVNIHRLQKIDPTTQIQQINLKTKNTDSLASTANSVKNIIESSDNHNFTVSYGDQITHPAHQILQLTSGVLALVASISLVVGGIGVMNIMLVAVAERAHEIGIRKAVGATNLHIFIQFLLESLILCCSGGILGLILGYIVIFLISLSIPFSPFISPTILLSVIITPIIIGTIFGLYPALKASLKNPIDSLKIYH